MEHSLLVCKQVVREAFNNEDYMGKEDILALVESGSFSFDCGNGVQVVGPLEAVNFKAGIFYHRQILEKASLYLFRYRTENSVFGSGKVTFRDVDRIRSTLALLRLCDAGVHLDDFSCKRALFGDLVNQYRLENATLPKEDTRLDPIIEEAVGQINRRLHEKINLAQLAGEFFLSYVQFSRRFKTATGVTPQDYITGARLKKAKTLLADTDMPVKQIAVNCGFGSEYYFSNFFRKYYHMAPTQYRVMMKTTEEI